MPNWLDMAQAAWMKNAVDEAALAEQGDVAAQQRIIRAYELMQKFRPKPGI